MFSQPATHYRLSAMICSVLLVGGCASAPPGDSVARPATHKQVSRPSVPAPPASARRSTGERAAVIAVRQIGTPYRYGGANPGGFDCSGLVQFAYSQAGQVVPRTTSTQWDAFSPVPRDRLRTGDVLFFRIQGKMSHVGLYLGDGRFVHAPSTGREVTIASLDSDFYRKAFIRAGRP